ncbi:MAG TPA: transcriptional regulator [Acidobacteriota bacterium]|nr:transcriptional regulator [Acidobacteriota bacterium]
MENADRLLRKIAGELRPVEEKILCHPFAPALERGEIPREKLEIFAGEQYGIITSDLRSVAHLLARAGTKATQGFFAFVLPGEQAALRNLLGFAAALGMNEETLSGYRQQAAAQAYKACMAWLALQRPHSEAAAAFLVNFPAWGQLCGRISIALKAEYGFNEEGVAFFEGFASPAPEFGEKARSVIAEGLAHGDDPAGIHAACRLLQEYELMFWDSLM